MTEETTGDKEDDNTVGSKHTENQCHMYCISVPKVLNISAIGTTFQC